MTSGSGNRIPTKWNPSKIPEYVETLGNTRVVNPDGSNIASTAPTGAATSAKQDTLINRLDTNINNFEEASATVNYLGMEDKDGVAVVEKIDTTSGVIITYATIINNPTRTTYTDLWDNRATNTYSQYGGAF